MKKKKKVNSRGNIHSSGNPEGESSENIIYEKDDSFGVNFIQKWISPDRFFQTMMLLGILGVISGAILGFSPKTGYFFTTLISLIFSSAVSFIFNPGIFHITKLKNSGSSEYYFGILTLISFFIFEYFFTGISISGNTVFHFVFYSIFQGFFFSLYKTGKSKYIDYVVILSVLTAVLTFSFGMVHEYRYTRLFVVPKIIAVFPFASLVAASIAIVIWKDKKRLEILKNPIVILFVLTFGYGIINVLTSTVPGISFFGSIIRQMGYITVVALGLTAVALALWIRGDFQRAEKFLLFMMFMGIVVSLRAFYEVTDPMGTSVRPSGFTGNPDFYGSNLLFFSLISWVFYFRTQKRIIAGFAGLAWIASFFALVLSQTRGAWAGLGIASFIGMFVFRSSREVDVKELRLRAIYLLVFTGISFLLFKVFISTALPETQKLAHAVSDLRDRATGNSFFVLMAYSPLLFKAGLDLFETKIAKFKFTGVIVLLSGLILLVPASRHPVIKQVSKAVRLKKLLDPVHGEARFKLWKDTIPMISDNLLKGTGRETYRINFLKYKTYKLAIKDPGVNYRSSHNIYLDYLVMEGLTGFLIYLSILITALLIGLKFSRSSSSGAATVAMAGVLCITGYAGHSLFIYDVIPTLAFYFLITGMMGGLMFRKNDETALENSAWGMKDISVVSTFALIFLVLMSIVVPWLISHHTADRLNSRNLALQASIKVYIANMNEFRNAEKEIDILEKKSQMFEQGNRNPGIIRSLAHYLKIRPELVKKSPKRVISAVKRIITRNRTDIDDKKTTYMLKNQNKVGETCKEMMANAEIIVRDGPKMGYHPYIAGHTLQTIIQVPSHARGGISIEKLMDFIVDASKKGIKNNTNPESAWSRLSSAYYARGTQHLRMGRLPQAWNDFKNALKSIEESISYDRWYYDTHRIRAIFMLDRFCDVDEAEKELKTVSSIALGTSHGGTRRNLFSFLPLYLKLTNSFHEKAAAEAGEERARLVKRTARSLMMMAEIEKEKRKEIMKRKPEESTMSREIISRMDEIIASMKNVIAGRGNMENIAASLANFQGGRISRVYSSCIRSKKQMEQAGKE